MPLEVAAVVLLGALLHAGWNALVKAGSDKLLDAARVCAGAAVLATLIVPWLPLPARESWPLLLASAAVHVLYFALLAAAYRNADLAHAYPLMRGIAPVLVAVVSGVFFGEHLGALAWASIALICGGVTAMALRAGRTPAAGVRRTTTGWALANAVVIAAYTGVDGMGARLSGHAVAYTLWMFILTAVPLLAWVLPRRPGNLQSLVRGGWRLSLAGGACAIGAYATTLWAMTQAPIALVAALRETSVLFALLIAAVTLKEHVGWRAAIAGAAIACGAAVLRFAGT